MSNMSKARKFLFEKRKKNRKERLSVIKKYLSSHPGITSYRISKHLNIPLSSTQNLINDLARRKLIRFQTQIHNGRKLKLIFLKKNSRDKVSSHPNGLLYPFPDHSEFFFQGKVVNIVVMLNPLKETIIINSRELFRYKPFFSNLQAKEFRHAKLIQFYDSSITIFLFQNGKMVITGMQGIYKKKMVIKKLNEIFLPSIIFSTDYNIKIVNICYVGAFKKKIKLKDTARLHEGTLYEPERFPGLIYKLHNSRNLTFFLFENGKFILTGGTEFKVIQQSILELFSRLKETDCFYER